MSKDSSYKDYQDNKGRLQTKACERYQRLFKEEEKKNDNMVGNDVKTSQKMKNILLQTENIITGYKKFLIFSSNYEKLFSFGRFVFLQQAYEFFWERIQNFFLENGKSVFQVSIRNFSSGRKLVLSSYWWDFVF